MSDKKDRFEVVEIGKTGAIAIVLDKWTGKVEVVEIHKRIRENKNKN